MQKAYICWTVLVVLLVPGAGSSVHHGLIATPACMNVTGSCFELGGTPHPGSVLAFRARVASL